MKARLVYFSTAVLLIMAPGFSEAQKKKKRRPKPALKQIDDVADLPRVLLIGDSISIGYTLPTRALLKDKANVHRIPTNGGDTKKGLASLDTWLGKGRWDVIHFNWGLHDLKYLNQKRQLAGPETGKHMNTIDQYEKNLRQLVQRLIKTGAKLIWASTTPVPEGSGGRVKGDAAKYNEVAARIMKEEGVTIDDLYSFAMTRLDKIQRPANVHFTPAGSKELAKQVAGHISKALQKK